MLMNDKVIFDLLWHKFCKNERINGTLYFKALSHFHKLCVITFILMLVWGVLQLLINRCFACCPVMSIDKSCVLSV